MVERGFLISVLRIGVSACAFIHLYSVLIYLQFNRIDSVFSTAETGVCACNPDSLRDCPCATVTGPSLLMWANTSQYVDTESTSPNRSHRKDTSKFLLSPLLYIYELYMVAA